MLNRISISDAFVFFKTITLKKLFNGLLLRLSYLISKNFGVYIHWGKPESLSIEPTNLCNLKCPECPSGNNGLTRPLLFLDTNNFYSIINEVYNHLSYLQLFFQGEPFLHPKVYDFINFAAKKGIYTSTSTNGHFLTPDNCNKIIKSGLHRIIISVDGTTQEVYEKYRVGGNLNLVTSGITNLINSKKKLKSRTPYVIMQFVVFGTNEHQIPDIKKLAKSLNVDKLQLKTAQIDDFKHGNPLIPKNKKYSRYIQAKNGIYKLNKKNNFKCWRIWNGAVITADDNLLPCCFDKDAGYPYGNLKNSTIQSGWKGKNAQLFRKHVWGKNNDIDICKNCSEGLKK